MEWRKFVTGLVEKLEISLVLGDKDVVILKTISSPSIQEFDDLIGTARRQAKAEGVTKSDITRAIARSRAKK
jgi:hypothetical protein